MEIFKFNQKNIINVCRELKELVNDDLKIKDYTEYSIMYDANKQEFYIINTFNTEAWINSTNVLYFSFHHYGIDGKVTIKYLKEKIFNM